MTEYETILVDRKDRITRLFLNRPEKRNCMNRKMIEELYDAFKQIKKDEETRVVVFAGKGESFCSGADISQIKEADAEWQEEYNRALKEVFDLMEELPHPIIAAVKGYTNFELFQTCDLVVVSEDAKIGLPEINIGLKPGMGADIRLAQFLGPFLTKELLFTGKWFDPEEVQKMGLVNKIVPSDELLDETLSLAEKISKKPPLAIASAKKAVNKQIDMRMWELQLQLFLNLFNTEDKKEGTTAFIEGRKPEFKGK